MIVCCLCREYCDEKTIFSGHLKDNVLDPNPIKLCGFHFDLWIRVGDGTATLREVNKFAKEIKKSYRKRRLRMWNMEYRSRGMAKK